MISTISFVGYSIYECISIPLYLRVIYVLIAKKEFSAPFFRFLGVIGILEIGHYVIDVVFYRLPIFGPTAPWFDNLPSPVYTVGTFLIYFFNYPIYALHIAIALNRWTSVWAPVKQKAFWLRAWKPIVLSAFALSFAFTAHRLFGIAKLVPLDQTDPAKGSIPIIVTYRLYFIDTNLLTASFNSFVFCCTLAINTTTFIKIMRMKRKGMLKNDARKIEFNLFIIVLWMTMTLVVLIIFQLSLFLLRTGLLNKVVDVGSLNYFLFMQQPVVEIIGTESHPWVLLIMCKKIRVNALPFLAKIKQWNSSSWATKSTTTKTAPIITIVMSTNKTTNNNNTKY